MNICFVNTHDIIGGAERCSWDLYRGLRARGHRTSLVVGRRLSDDSDVHQCHYPAWDWKPRAFLHGRAGLTDTTLVTPFRMIYGHPSFRTADIVNLHNMHGCYWNFWTLPALARKVPVVLTLHDEWLFTGDCAYTYDCDRWRQSCGSCPQMSWDVRPNLGGRDNTRLNLFLKRAAVRLSRHERVHVVTPSKWLAERAMQTELKRFPMSLIPYGVDLTRFRPRDRNEMRAKFGLAENVFCFLFLANNLDDPRKGSKRLERALAVYGLPPNSCLLLAGNGAGALMEKFKDLPIRNAGYLAGPERVAECLAAVDCMLLLSEADNLPYAGIEASACGCPVLALDSGGIPEIVEDGVNGSVLPRSAGPESLAASMREMATMDSEGRERRSARARAHAARDFAMREFLRKYERLFENMIDNHGAPRPATNMPMRDQQSFEREIVAYAITPTNRERFARLLNDILPSYITWTWGKEGIYQSHFNEWQHHGFNLTPNHYYSPIPDVASLTQKDFGRHFSMHGVDLREEAQCAFLTECMRFRDEYARFSLGPGESDNAFHFNNGVFESGDAEILHCMIRHYQPRRIIEVGSGFTTLITAAACEANRKLDGVPCNFTAIEPHPNDLFLKSIPGLSSLIREPLQNIDLDLFLSLKENDVLFIDSTHVLKIGGDVQLLYLEIIPRLNPGVIVHVHDIFLPAEYPRDWVVKEHIFWNEQYLLQAFLSFNSAFEVLWAGAFMHWRHAEKLSAAFRAYDPSRHLPGSFWIRRHT